MIDPGTVGAIASTVGVTAVIAWRFFVAFNSKTDKVTTDRIFKLVDEDRKDIAEMGGGMSAMGRDVQHLTTTVGEVSKDVKEILRNGKNT